MDIIPTSAKEFVMQISVNNFLQHFSNLLPCDNFGDKKFKCPNELGITCQHLRKQ